MKLWCQSPLKSTPESPVGKLINDLIQRDYALVKRPDTETVRKPLEKGLVTIGQLGYSGFRFLNDREIVKSVLQAEREGFDSVVITCYFDPGVTAARALLNIPVVGAAESSMHIATMMGSRFATVTSDTRYVAPMTQILHRYSMSNFAIERNPVRSIGLSESQFLSSLANNQSRIIKDFTEVAKGCIQDGADVIIAGCGVMAPVLTLNGLRDVDGVPVVDPNLVSIKMAEMMVDLHKAGIPAISRKGIYLMPSSDEREILIRQIYGIGTGT